MKIGAYSSIEPLESRVAPASVLTYTDVDGDQVKITSSAGDLNAVGVATFDITGHQLQLLTLTDPSFQRANITTVVTQSGLGDGLVNIGRINAEGRDLGTVKIKGDLWGIFCGDNNTSANSPAIKALDVLSMGNYGTLTQGGGTNLISSVNGQLGSLIVHGDVKDAAIHVSAANPADGSIGSVSIGGSLIGGAVARGAEITSTGSMGSVKIGGNMIGSDKGETAEILCDGRLGSLSIGGSLIGGGGALDGRIIAGSIGAAKIGGSVLGGPVSGAGFILSQGDFGSLSIGGSLVGGAGNETGEIQASGKMGQLTIGGSILGGTGDESGKIHVFGELKALKVGGDLRGGSNTDDNVFVFDSGYIQANRIGSVFIGGSVVAGLNETDTFQLLRNACIRVEHDIGSLTVKGSLIGTRGPTLNTPVQIFAVGQERPGNGVDLAIGKISIGGRVDNAEILAGWSIEALPVNGNASIGSVSVHGDWAGSVLAAGVRPPPGGFFGTAGSTLIHNGEGDAIIAKIASITIGGSVIGTTAAGDHFGFTAQQIGSFKAAGFTAKLSLSQLIPDTIELSPTTGDVTILEVFPV